jgi:DNA-binding PadR family transcriptional regulator
VAERGGRAKYLYALTREGQEALREVRRILKSLWTEDCELAFK